MSAVGSTADTSQKSAKRKKKNKKKANGKPEEATKSPDTNGVKEDGAAEAEEDADEDDEVVETPTETSNAPHLDNLDSNTAAATEDATGVAGHDQVEPDITTTVQTSAPEPGQQAPSVDVDKETEQVSPDQTDAAATNAKLEEEEPSETDARLQALQQERDNLRHEVTQLRQQLESLQTNAQGDESVSLLREELDQTRQGKEHAETQYRNLLGKVNTIRSQLGDRLKADAEELEQARGKIEQLESAHTVAKDENERLQGSVSELSATLEAQTAEIESLRSRTSLSTSNWAKERDDLVAQETYIREEYEVAKQAMQDWEILATEERSRREAAEERAQELEERLNGQTESYERARNEADTQSSTVDGLQRALRDIQEERKRELRETVEQSQSQLDELRKQAKSAEDSAAELKQLLEATQKELERALPYEKEVREKNLLIGKLRHEAVILNDHLTKALRFLKRGKPEDNVDRQLVTNHLLQFLALDRSDPKKFQVLQLVAALLGWTEEQREQAGLLRQGSLSSTNSLRLPLSPFRRTPSTPSLTTEFMPDSVAGSSKESLAELWSEFLEREAQAGTRSRTGSVATRRTTSISAATSPVAGRKDSNFLGSPMRKESYGPDTPGAEP